MLARLILNPLVDLISGFYIQSMIVYSSSSLPNVNYSMKPENSLSDSTLDLFADKADAEFADEFAMELEAKAAALEITVDYYMQEFM
jgi:hypothetical protein